MITIVGAAKAAKPADSRCAGGLFTASFFSLGGTVIAFIGAVELDLKRGFRLYNTPLGAA